jgi:signal transduction histidine kinase
VVHTDITERKLAERDARLARESMSRAARLNAVGILAASLTHELTQPLSAVSFFSAAAASLLEQEAPPVDRLRAILTRVDEQITRASTTLQRLREFLRRQEMTMQPVAIERIIEDAVDLIRSFAADHGVRLKFQPTVPSLRVIGDIQQLEQVLVNLISNSIQAIDAAGSDRREVVIDARLRSAAATGGSAETSLIQVSVQDTGPGLPGGDAETLFNIFETKRDSEIGLGLAISRDIVESHGGRLWAEPAPMQGACFHFTLPPADDGES